MYNVCQDKTCSCIAYFQLLRPQCSTHAERNGAETVALAKRMETRTSACVRLITTMPYARVSVSGDITMCPNRPSFPTALQDDSLTGEQSSLHTPYAVFVPSTLDATSSESSTAAICHSHPK